MKLKTSKAKDSSKSLTTERLIIRGKTLRMAAIDYNTIDMEETSCLSKVNPDKKENKNENREVIPNYTNPKNDTVPNLEDFINDINNGQLIYTVSNQDINDNEEKKLFLNFYISKMKMSLKINENNI